MTDTPDQRQTKARARRPPASDYEVGYGKPPQQTRFKPGQSGNPRGRPKGAKAKPALPALHDERLKSIIIEEAYRLVGINDPRGELSIPMAQAVVRSLAVTPPKAMRARSGSLPTCWQRRNGTTDACTTNGCRPRSITRRVGSGSLSADASSASRMTIRYLIPITSSLT